MHCPDTPLRLQLADAAARGADVLPQLRLLLLAEALAAPPTVQAIDLNAETAALCEAALEGVRRRAGWLYCVPSPAPLPVQLPRCLWQTALLCLLRGAMPAGRAVVTLRQVSGAAVVMLRASPAHGLSRDTLPLLRRAAALCGGVCVCTEHAAAFSAALRLPLAPHALLREPPTAADLLLDRYSAFHALLDGFTV